MDIRGDMPEQDPTPPFWEDEKDAGNAVDLLSSVIACVRGWPLLVLMGGVGAAIGLTLGLVLTPLYTSKVVFLPPQQHVSPLDNPLSSLFKTPSSEVYSGLLTSDSILGEVVLHTGLQQKYHSKNLPNARLALRQHTTVSTETTGFVTLQVKATDPALSRQIADAYLEALSHLNDRLAVSDAARHRDLYKMELEKEKDGLEAAEVALKQAQEQSGVILPQVQTQAGLNAIESNRAAVRALEVRLADLRKSETDQAPEVVSIISQLSALRGQLNSMEHESGPAGGALSASRAPQLNLDFVRLEREVKYHQALFDAVTRQYENARLEESSTAPGVQVVDFPETPVAKSWPPRLLYVVFGGLLGLTLGLVFLAVRAQIHHLMANPARREFVDRIVAAARNGSLRA